LLLKGVEAVSNHGGKSQSEREEAVLAFKNGKADVLVATDIAAKGLDFQNVQHVINFDCPEDIESYVHRIGRTGRRGQKGVATTFINNTADSQVLMDLKYLLKEAKQKIPDCLFDLVDPVREASAFSFLIVCKLIFSFRCSHASLQKLWGIQMHAPTAVAQDITSAIAGFSWRGESRPLVLCRERKVARGEDFDVNAGFVWLLQNNKSSTLLMLGKLARVCIVGRARSWEQLRRRRVKRDRAQGRRLLFFNKQFF
jgi:superfamily II DNA helicase RecQ